MIIIRPSFLIGYMMGFFLIFLVPTDFFQSKFAETIINISKEISPSINGYWNNSKFPEISVIYFAIQPIIFFPVFIDLIKNKDLNFNKLGFDGVYKKLSTERFPRITCIFAITFFLLLAFIVFFQPGYQFSLMPINESKIALAFFGPLAGFCSIYAMAAMAYSYFVLLRRF